MERREHKEFPWQAFRGRSLIPEALRGQDAVMKAIFQAVVMVMCLAGAAVADDERPIFYPFDVTVGGQKAEMQEGNMLFAVVKDPVKADAVVAIEQESPLFIINAFACKEDGSVMEPGAQPAVMFNQNAKETKLNATMDKKPLKPGTYLMNIVAHNKTSRVVFTIEDKTGKIKMPDFKKVFEFLSKKK